MSPWHRLIVAFVAAVGILTPAATFAQSAPIVVAPAGQISGVRDGAMDMFKGIPYALPPVGALRWKPPQPMPRWSGVKEAADFGPICIQPQAQPTPSNIYSSAPVPMSEDCLTLNIWVPAGVHDAPVFFWIHGGSLWYGSGRGDAAKLASHGMIVVTINYRLGVLGYLAHPELSAESPLHISGNYGLLDQIAALRWVHQNIAAFGGNPANVTIAGESAGALSVMYLLTSPDARGLFAKAIAESGYMISTPDLREHKFGEIPAEEAGVTLAAKLHAPNIAALRAMDATTLDTAALAAGFLSSGTVDGHILPRQLVDTFDKHEQAPVPLLAGFNSGEIRSLPILMPPTPSSSAGYEKEIRARFGDLADAFLARYPASDVHESMLTTVRDAFYGWSMERLVRKQAALGVPAYLYYFDHGYPAEDAAGLHGFHASEVPYVWGRIDHTLIYWPKIPATPLEQNMADAMDDYWASFARTGQPQAKGKPDWLSYGSDANYMAFEDTPQASTHLLPGMYSLHEEIVCRRRMNGTMSWNLNFGVIAPPLPAPDSRCAKPMGAK